MYLDFSKKTLRINLVYYGIPFSGKSTTISKILECPSNKANRIQPIYFYGLDAERGILGEYIPEKTDSSPIRLIFQLMALPGYSGYVYDKAHKLLLSKADGIIFVADSQKTKIQENDVYFEVLIRRIKDIHHQCLWEFPFVLQWNKDDLESSMPVERSKIYSRLPETQIYRSSAIKNKGILEAMNHCISMIFDKIQGIWPK